MEKNELIIQLNFRLHNVFKPKASTKPDDKGELKPAKWQLQYLNETESDEGTQMEIGKVSLPLDTTEAQVKKYQESVGKEVIVNVKCFANEKKQVVFYGV